MIVYFLRARRLCVTIALMASAIGATFLQASANVRADVVGTPQQRPDSKIEITDVFAINAVAINPFAGMTLQYPVECVFFKNDGNVPAKRVRFYFSYTALSGPNQGEVVGEDFIDTRGTFTTGIAQETWPARNAPVPGKQCRNLPGRIDGSHFDYGKTGAVGLSAYVSEVDFADGTSWKAPSASPSPSPSPSNTP